MNDELRAIGCGHPERCMKCGKCTASCPNYAAMEYHPHQFAEMLLHGKLAELAASALLCAGCMVCTERCPRDVQPSRIADAARTLALRQKDADALSPDVLTKLADAPQQLFMAAMRRGRN